MERKSEQDTVYTRTAIVEAVRAEGEETRYTASLSSEYGVERYGYTEVLAHSAESINMERASNGLVLLFNHDTDKPIGRINNIGLREGDKKLVGELTFSETAAGQEKRAQVDEGTLTDISIRYSIEETEKDEDERTGQLFITATRWTPLEGSLVSVPADPTVGMGRDLSLTKTEGLQMENDNAKTGKDSSAGGVVVEFEQGRKTGQAEGAALERQRTTKINELFTAPGFKGAGFDGLRQSLVNNGSTVDQARAALLEMAGGNADQQNAIGTERGFQADTQSHTPHITAKDTRQADMMRDMQSAANFKAGLETGEEAREAHSKNHFAGWSFSEMARECLNNTGIDTRGMSPRDVVGYALNPNAVPHHARSGFVGQGTSGFPALVENIANKAMMQGFNESDETWRQICRIGQVSSFRQESRVDMSSFSDLDEVAENGEYKHGAVSDAKEYIQAKKYGKLFAITREMIVNDDLNGMQAVPRLMGRAADRKIGDLVYAILTGNPNLQDGTALFDAARSNIITSGAAPSVAQLDEMMKLMALQSDISGNATGQNIGLSTLIVPVALKVTATILANAASDPDQKTTQKGGGGTSPNPFAGTFNVVADPRLDAASSTVYYGSANPTLHSNHHGFLAMAIDYQ